MAGESWLELGGFLVSLPHRACVLLSSHVPPGLRSGGRRGKERGGGSRAGRTGKGGADNEWRGIWRRACRTLIVLHPAL